MKEKNLYPKWPVTVTNQTVEFEDEEAWKEHLIPFEGRKMVLVIKRDVKVRSRAEEKFYHAVVVRLVAEEMDITRDEAHELLRGLFLKVEEHIGKYRYTRLMSTTELSDEAYQSYWKQCIRWAALPTRDYGLDQDSGLGLYIPHPNEVDYENCY